MDEVMPIVPMPSARMGNGRYEVIGTSHAVECLRIGREWFLEIDGCASFRIGPFRTKRAALQHAQSNPDL